MRDRPSKRTKLPIVSIRSQENIRAYPVTIATKPWPQQKATRLVCTRKEHSDFRLTKMHSCVIYERCICHCCGCCLVAASAPHREKNKKFATFSNGSKKKNSRLRGYIRSPFIHVLLIGINWRFMWQQLTSRPSPSSSIRSNT